jgi:hypothetical protein
MIWQKFNDLSVLDDDSNYLVAWKFVEGEYSTYHRAYYIPSENKFFSLENNNSHPLHVDAFLKIPNIECNMDKK